MEHKSVLLDSNIIIALFYKQDSLHEKSEDLLGAHSGKNIQILLHPLVFIESLTVLRMRLTTDQLVACQRELQNRDSFDHITTPLTVYKKDTWMAYFKSFTDLSVTDAIILDYCISTKVELLTLDKKLNAVYQKELSKL
jgi:predicted nucleic acid-binding protein